MHIDGIRDDFSLGAQRIRMLFCVEIERFMSVRDEPVLNDYRGD